MPSRTQITLSSEVHRRARTRAAELGVSFAEYVRRLVEADLREPGHTADPSILFNLGRTEGSNVAGDKDGMIAEAMSAQHAADPASR